MYDGIGRDPSAARQSLIAAVKYKQQVGGGEVPNFGGYDQGVPIRKADDDLGTQRYAGDKLGSLGLNGTFGLATDDDANQDYFRTFTERQEGGPFALMAGFGPPPEGPPPEGAA